ncbi:hypothetical protein GCM10020331_060700 [Ectobacillus funiculus]
MNTEVAGEELECMITPMLSIVRRDTAQEYEYMLVHKEKKSRQQYGAKMKRKKAETMKVTEQLLFIVPKTGEKGNRKRTGESCETNYDKNCPSGSQEEAKQHICSS